MKNWKEIPIPQLMLDLKRDPRGLPVPFVVLVDENGKHHFKINDTKKTLQCLTQGLCHVCGKELVHGDTWMVGGISSAFDDRGYYVDGPIHKQCGEYALKVCPYMVHSNYTLRESPEDLEKKLGNGIKLHSNTVDFDRLPLFVFASARVIRLYPDGESLKFVPEKPFLEVEFWDEDEQITHLEIIEMKLQGTKWEQYLQNIYKLPQYEALTRSGVSGNEVSLPRLPKNTKGY